MGYFLGSNFHISFWSNFLADALIAIISAVLIYLFTDFFKKPTLILVIKQNGFYRDNILLSKRTDGDYEATFQFAIKNSGNQTVNINQGYWHTLVLDENSESPYSVAGEKNHQRDIIRDNIYPNSFVDIAHPWKFHIKKENLNNWVPYFFKTDYGYFPKTVKMDEFTGKIPVELMGRIEYKIEE